MYSNSICKQSSMPTSIFMLLLISGYWDKVCTTISCSRMISLSRRTIVTRNKYLFDTFKLLYITNNILIHVWYIHTISNNTWLIKCIQTIINTYHDCLNITWYLQTIINKYLYTIKLHKIFVIILNTFTKITHYKIWTTSVATHKQYMFQHIHLQVIIQPVCSINFY